MLAVAPVQRQDHHSPPLAHVAGRHHYPSEARRWQHAVAPLSPQCWHLVLGLTDMLSQTSCGDSHSIANSCRQAAAWSHWPQLAPSRTTWKMREAVGRRCWSRGVAPPRRPQRADEARDMQSTW